MPSDHVPHPFAGDERNREVVSLRLPSHLLERVDAHLETLRASAPAGVEVTRAAAIRNLLELALTTERAA